MATRSIQDSIRETLLNDHGIELSVVQIGAFWQSTDSAAQILSDLLGISQYQPGAKGQTYAGFPVGANHHLEEVRRSGHSWAIVVQVGQSERGVIRRVAEASNVGALDVQFEGASRV